MAKKNTCVTLRLEVEVTLAFYDASQGIIEEQLREAGHTLLENFSPDYADVTKMRVKVVAL